MDKEEKRRTQYALMAAMTHGGIGIWSRVALAPLDRIKILRQTQIIPGRNIFSDARCLMTFFVIILFSFMEKCWFFRIMVGM